MTDFKYIAFKYIDLEVNCIKFLLLLWDTAVCVSRHKKRQNRDIHLILFLKSPSENESNTLQCQIMI